MLSNINSFLQKFPIKGYTGANKVSLFLQCLIAILNLNILYSFINSLTITLGHDGSSANTLTIDPITTTQQQGHVDYTPIKFPATHLKIKLPPRICNVIVLFTIKIWTFK